ncbi:FecR family protein [Methylobacterium sp. R2-1]|uniref:FecR family protein n=1 Tax=Methylobacterium sp. R2-1 TaxID=2587064 RepID=UPI001609B3F9|nr:FecR domain-containing protein [Methylobacterium sp. R2-1]MBB2964586.1 transmembrane sensor [Methylobacterium sp. R2-1]
MTGAENENRPNEPTSASLDAQARAWIVRLTSGSATQADADACAAWRAIADHEAAFRAATRLWQQTGPALRNGVPAQERQALPRPTRRQVLRRAAWGAGAASVAAGGGAIALRWQELSATHRTGTGEVRSVKLPDGTRLDLDAQTALDLETIGQRHVVSLHAGALVVTAPENVPVTIRADDTQTNTRPDLAAELAVSCRLADNAVGWFGHADVGVACLSGEADFQSGAGVTPTRLRAGHGIETGHGAGIVHGIDAATAAAWRRGLLVFRDTPLAAVVSDLNRYRPGRIMLASAVATSRRVTGVFHLDRPDEALTSIGTALGLTEYRLGAGLVVLR